jgi:hypothetical protein
MTLNELRSYYTSLLENITSNDNTVDREALLGYVLPSLNSARLTDSEEISYAYYKLEKENVEVDGYLFNNTQERLQIFISNLLLPGDESLIISRKDHYDTIFARARNFVNKSIKGYLKEIQASDPVSLLVRFLESAQTITQIDVVEIFLISNSTSIEPRGHEQSPKSFVFADDEIAVKVYDGKLSHQHTITVKYQLIDLNKIYGFEVSEGNSEPIVINFDPPLPAIKAADDGVVFESYLAVISAERLVGFYKSYSSRLLERNVRSFLQFKGANKEMKNTLTVEPERFIAYNNGLTVTCTSSEILTENGISMISSLTDFQIVNGGQTTASIYFASKDGVDVSKVNVTAKINIVKTQERENLDDLISKISQFSNLQSRVSNVDLNSRSVFLVRIKNLSESITDPKGQKWFFERVRGEFNTMVKLSAKQKASIEKNYPRHKRLSKEQLAKYFVAWGNSPFLVRKGGERVFRDFMDFIQLDISGKALEPENMGRSFYEDLIAKTIIFKELENMYGTGSGAIGQIRSSVVPYTMSVLFSLTKVKKHNRFDLGKVWAAQEIPTDLKDFAKELLQAVHNWCKKYSKSDDVGEYAKREELWALIQKSEEYRDYEKNILVKELLARYLLSEDDFKKRYTLVKVYDFSLIAANARIHGNSHQYYTKVKLQFSGFLSVNEQSKIEQIVQKIQVKHNISGQLIEFEEDVLHRLQLHNPDWFIEQQALPSDINLLEVLNFVTTLYNKNIHRVQAAFDAESLKAEARGGNERVVKAIRNIGAGFLVDDGIQVADLYRLGQFMNG